jgi:hypothetical protein
MMSLSSVSSAVSKLPASEQRATLRDLTELDRRDREERSRSFVPISLTDQNHSGKLLTTPIPSNDQRGFLFSDADERWAFGGNRSGKTELAVQDCDMFCRGLHPVRSAIRKPPVKVRYCAPKWRDGIEGVVLLKFKEVCQRHLLRGGSWQKAWSEKEHKLHYANGSTIHFKSGEEDLDTFGGADLDAVYQDERLDRKRFRENKMRLIDRGGFYVSAMTPEMGITWERDHVQMPPEHTSVSHWFFCSYGNPHLNAEALGKMAGDLKDEKLIQAKIYGQFVALGGLVIPQYNPQVHIIPDRPIPAEWYRVFAIDPHHKKPTAMLWAVWTPENDLWVYRCAKEMMTVPELKQFIRAQSAGEKIKLFIGDEAMGGDGLNIYGQKSVLKQLAEGDDRIPVMPTNQSSDKTFESGIFKLREMFGVDPMSGEAQIYIFKSCDWPIKYINGQTYGSLPWELERYEYRQDQKADEESFRERVRTVDDDLLSDLRYIAMAGPQDQEESKGGRVVPKGYRLQTAGGGV